MSSSGFRTVRKPKHDQPSVIEPLRVLISATSTFARARLERLLEKEPSVEVAGAISSADPLAPAIAENDPDVVLLHLEAQLSETEWEEMTALAVPIVLLADEADLASATRPWPAGCRASFRVTQLELNWSQQPIAPQPGCLRSRAIWPILCAKAWSPIHARRQTNL